MTNRNAKSEYMDFIKKNPKFIPGGELDEFGFYFQADGSSFDPEGIYFNVDGFDEFGGYYDGHGVYQEEYNDEGEDYEDYGSSEDHVGRDYIVQTKIDPILALIDGAAPGSTFCATLGNLPHRTWDDSVRKELTSKGIRYEKLDFKRGDGNKLLSVKVTMKDKASAKALMSLHETMVMGRKLFVDFPDFVIDEALLTEKGEEIKSVVHIPEASKEAPSHPTPAPTSVPTPVPTQAPVQAAPQAPQTTQAPSDKIVRNDAPEIEKKKVVHEHKKAEKKPVAQEEIKEVPKDTKSVWDLPISFAQNCVCNGVIVDASKQKTSTQTKAKVIKKAEGKKEQKKSGKK